MKFFNYKRYKFSTIFKNISIKRYNFQKLLKYLYYKDFSYLKINKYISLKRFNYSKLYKYIDPRSYNYLKLYKLINFKNYKYITIIIPVGILSSIFIYLSMPIFYDFNKSKIESLICKGFKVSCSIEGKIKYSFLPSPRVKFNDFIIKDLSKDKKILANIKKIDIKISLKNLHDKEKINYKKINLIDGEINFDLKNLKTYKNIFQTKFNLKNVNFKKMNIKFFDDEKYITAINNAAIKYKSKSETNKVNINGDFFGRSYCN